MTLVSRPSRISRSQRRGHSSGPAPRKLETAGLIVVAILILAITILRYWHNMNWRAR